MYTLAVCLLPSLPCISTHVHMPHTQLTLTFTGVFEENRLIVAVTYFDTYYEKCRHCSDSDEDDDELEDVPLSPDKVKQKIVNHVLKATDGAHTIPRENIIPICGQWALYSRLLSHKPSDPHLRICGKMFFDTLGQDPPCEPAEMAHKLEESSGIQEIERRYDCQLHCVCCSFSNNTVT